MACPHGYENADYCEKCNPPTSEINRLREWLGRIATIALRDKSEREILLLKEMARSALAGEPSDSIVPYQTAKAKIKEELRCSHGLTASQHCQECETMIKKSYDDVLKR
jgi:hypothetical protein